MSRKRTLYLSELILRLSDNTLNGITVICTELCIIWHYKSKKPALEDLRPRKVLWDRQVNKYTIIDNHMQIELK